MLLVRPAVAADAPAVAALVREVHALHAAAHPALFQPADAAPLTPADVARLIERAGPLFLVAEHEGAFAGHARAELLEEPASPYKRASRMLHVHEMGVVPAHRRHGVGRALLEAVHAHAVALAAQGVSLDVYGFNAAARAFYARAGFTTLRERLVAPARPADG